MKILAIADSEDKALWDFYKPEMLREVELIIGCGDLSASYLEFLVTMANCPLLYVRGNHDESLHHKPPLGCINIDDQIYNFRGIRIMGLGGSMRYNDSRDMYTEGQMRKRIKQMRTRLAIMNGFDILVTHAPAAGYGDMEDLPHRGFDCFNELLERWHPAYMLFGHVHKEYGHFERQSVHSSGTKLINAYGKYYLDIKDDEHPARGKTGSPLYDLYVSLKKEL